MTSNQEKFIFRKHDNVGAASAEEDESFLDDGFVDTGELALLQDCRNPKRIIVGRTGTGKSALIRQLAQTNHNVCSFSPHDLSLNFIATSNVISFFEEAGVNLSLFYVLLWKHLLVVELLKKKFNIVTEDAQSNYVRTFKELISKKDNYKAMALEYLEQWGDKFWLTAEQRVHELTSRVETELASSINGKIPGISLSAEGARKLEVIS